MPTAEGVAVDPAVLGSIRGSDRFDEAAASARGSAAGCPCDGVAAVRGSVARRRGSTR